MREKQTKTKLKVVEHKLEVVEENIEFKIDVSCALEAKVDEKLAEVTSNVEDRIKPLIELTQNSIVEAMDTYVGEDKDKEKASQCDSPQSTRIHIRRRP